LQQVLHLFCCLPALLVGAVITLAVYLVTLSLIVYRVYITQQMLEFVVMLQMKLFALSFLQFTILSLFSQEHKDYIVKLNNDTVFTKVIKIDKKMKSVLFEENGKKIRYETKDVLVLKYDTLFYEVGIVRLKRFNQCVFLRQTVKGRLNLYEIDTKKKKFLARNFVEDLIRLRWVYRAQDWAKKYHVTVYFYKKENESRESFSKSWKEKAQDCKLLQDKIKSKTAPWSPMPKEIVQFYNLNCI
jgi:hypothetical protein